MNPVILYNNKFEAGKLTATDTAAGFSVDNIVDRNPDTCWVANSAGAKHITNIPLVNESVILADMRISALDGYAFVDFSAADLLTNNLGKRLVVIDSAGKKAIGYIKAVSVNTPSSILKICASPSVVYASWENNGIWEHNGDGWARIHATNPIGMTAGSSLLFASFSGNGLWKYDGATWTKLNTDEPTVMGAYGTLLFYAYGTNKAYKYDTATDTRTQIASGSVVNVISAGDDIAFMDIVRQGAWRYVPSTNTWTDLSGADTDILCAAGSITYGTFPGYAKTYQWSGSGGSWNEIHASIKASAGAVVNNTTFYAALSDGIYQYISGTTWTKISSDIPTMMSGSASKLYAYFGATKTLKSWDGVDWVTILSPSDTGVTITSTPDGDVFNWESIESGFDYADAGGYAYKISESDAINGLGIMGHNLSTAGASVSFVSSDDGTNWTERLAAFTPSSDNVILKSLTSFRAAYKRLTIDTDSVEPYIGEAWIGEFMEMPYTPDTPETPYEEGIESEMTLSRGGKNLGVVTSYFPIDLEYRFSNLLRTWVTENYVPFWEYAKYLNAFFFAPDLDIWPDDVFWCVIDPSMKFKAPTSMLLYVDYIDLKMWAWRRS